MKTFIEKYKPYYVKDFYVNDTFRNVLNTLFEIDDLNVLFVGNISSGKTTLLYAILREYYGLSDADPFPENNIMHINNLKEQGINYYRNEMKTFCRSSSNIFGKKKLILVDDLDMINEQSQQVFRNYIDKYKNNIHFISVCTSIQKVIESIQSRVHIIKLEIPSQQYLEELFDKIVCQENIVIDQESRNFLLQSSKYSIRSLINHLERIYILGQPITLELCKSLCSPISFEKYETYIECIRNRDLANAIKIMYGIYDYGYSVIDILDFFFTFVKSTSLLSEDEKYQTIQILCKYITIFHNVHEDAIELSLFTKSMYQLLYQDSNNIPVNI